VNPPEANIVESVVDELIASRWSDPTLDLDVFGNRVSSGQYRAVYEAAVGCLPERASVLDWGCGNGHLSYFLVRMGYRTTGFSFLESPRLMRQFGERFCFVQGSDKEPMALPFDPESFDAVVSMGVLEHVRETGGEEHASLCEIRRILKPGGVFLCAHFPNRYSWIEFLTRNFLPSKFHHRYRFTPGDIRGLWGGAGFDLRLVRRYAWLPRNLTSRVRPAFMNSGFALGAYGVMEGIAKAIMYPFHQNFLIVAVKRS
jgi:SAM-dependent methyltransferase